MMTDFIPAKITFTAPWRITLFLAILLLELHPAASVKLSAQPRDNGEVLMDLGSALLADSRTWQNAGSPIVIEAEIPAPLKSRLINGLMDSGKQIRMDGEGVNRLRLEWSTHNSIIRIGRDSARRTLSGNLTVYHLSADGDILGTEVLPFSFEDIVDTDTAEILTGTWSAGQFRVSELDKRPGLWRRIAEPAIIIAATGVSVFLLYNVRSR
jgi:hypothetical protein